MPFILVYNYPIAIFGIPLVYFAIFVFWIVSILVSYFVLKKHYE